MASLPALLDEHADRTLGEHLPNGGAQRLQPRLSERKTCQKPNKCRAPFWSPRRRSHELVKPAELGFVVGIDCKPETAEKGEVLMNGWKVVICLSPHMFAVAFWDRSLNGANQIRRAFACAGLHRYDVNEF